MLSAVASNGVFVERTPVIQNFEVDAIEVDAIEVDAFESIESIDAFRVLSGGRRCAIVSANLHKFM